MTITFSNEVMQAMGFREFAEAEAITATFSSVTVYEARGITIPVGTTVASDGAAAGINYKLAAAASVNDACSALIADTFTENEDEWKKENKTQGPFVLVLLGSSQEHSCTSGRIKLEADGSATTYDCFPGVRLELAQLESRALAPIVSGLSCVLNEESRYVALRKLARASVGRTKDGRIVHDIRMEFRAEMYTSYNLANPQLAEKLNLAKSLTPTLNQKAARFFALGLAEDDQLKRFLYFFLALEVETHATFGRIDHAASLTRLLDQKTERSQSSCGLIGRQVEGLKNLYDRFVWCAACVWLKLSDADIAQFKALKGARDDIAHGSASEPPIGYARQAELLAHKVLWSAK